MKKATFVRDGRVYMDVEESSFAEIKNFLSRNGWTRKAVTEEDFPLTVSDGSGEEFEVTLEDVPDPPKREMPETAPEGGRHLIKRTETDK